MLVQTQCGRWACCVLSAGGGHWGPEFRKDQRSGNDCACTHLSQVSCNNGSDDDDDGDVDNDRRLWC